MFLTLVYLYIPIDRGMTSPAAKRSSCDNCCAQRKKTFLRVREDMKMNEIVFLLVFPMVLQTANAAIMQFDICPATNGVANCRKFYWSFIRIVSSEPPREIFVPKCGQQIIPLGMKMLVSHNGKRCYGTCNTPLFLLFEFSWLLNSPSSRLLLAGQLSKLVSGFYIEVKYKVQHFKTKVTFITFNHCVFSIPVTRLRDNTHNSLKNHNYTIANQERFFDVFDDFK